MVVGAGSGGSVGTIGSAPTTSTTAAPVTLVWKWLRWTRWPLDRVIVALAAATVVFDIVTAWRDVELGHLGFVPVSPTLPLELALIVLLGWRRLGLDRTNLAAWHEFLAVGTAAMLFGVIQYSRHIGGFAEAMGSWARSWPSSAVATGATPRTGARAPGSRPSSRRVWCSPCCPVTWPR
jgi:hypothetical protein